MQAAVYLLVHLLLPLALLGTQWTARLQTRAQWFTRSLAFGAFLLALHLAGVWLPLPIWLSTAYLAAWALGVLFTGWRFRRLPWRAPPTASRLRLDIWANAIFAFAFAVICGYALSGRLPPNDGMADLSFPLRDGNYLVASGGSNRLLNFHLKTLKDPKFRDWRGQSYAVDLVELGRYGLRAEGLMPDKAADYEIFGETLYAPCDGLVLRAADGLQDPDPPERMEADPFVGNHVLINCDGIWVLLAHMQRGSVRAQAGELVAAGQPIGAVGNSGRSDEPHLHIHAQRPGRADAPFDADPVPITFGGRYLSRNERIVAE